MEEFIEHLKKSLQGGYFNPDEKYEYNGKVYYVKMLYDKENVLNELIAAKLMSVFDITCAKYKLFSYEGEYYYVSEDLKSLGNDFILLSDLLKSRSREFDKKISVSKRSLYALWDIFEEKFTESIGLMNDLIKVYIFDILFNNPDRHYKNIGVIMPLEKLAVLDNELIFSSTDSFYISSFLNLHHSYQYELTEELEEFFLESDSYYYSLFNHYYDIFTPAFVLNIIESVEKEENIFIDDAKLMDRYIKRYEKIGRILLFENTRKK